MAPLLPEEVTQWQPSMLGEEARTTRMGITGAKWIGKAKLVEASRLVEVTMS